MAIGKEKIGGPWTHDQGYQPSIMYIIICLTNALLSCWLFYIVILIIVAPVSTGASFLSAMYGSKTTGKVPFSWLACA